MIKRIWRGWTTPDNADAYEALLNTTIAPGIAARHIDGHASTEIYRRRDPDTDEVEFVTIMTFDSWESIEAFAGGDGRGSVVPDAARALLTRFDEHSAHYDLRGSH